MVEYIQKRRNPGKREENKIWVRYEDPGRLELSTLSSLSLSLSFQSRPSPLFLSLSLSFLSISPIGVYARIFHHLFSFSLFLFPFHLTHWSICGGGGGGWTRGTHSQTIELHLNSTLPGTQNWSDTPTCVCSLLMWWV